MVLVVVGGQARNVGKTSVIAGLIAALPEFHWLAAKITQHGHGVCSRSGEPCDCACDEASLAILEENDRSGTTDTSRFLAAGAEKSLWVRTEQGKLGEVMPALRQKLADAQNVIIESNSVLDFLKPDLYLQVLDHANADFKPSARRFLDRADALVVSSFTPYNINSSHAAPHRDVPTFCIDPPSYVTPQIVEFVRSRLEARLKR